MVNKNFIPKRFRACLEEVYIYFLSDTIILLDQVLSGAATAPESTARIVYNRLKRCMWFENMYKGKEYLSVFDYISACGYADEDIQNFQQKYLKEKESM